jgi:hypothetical protein
MQSAPEIIPLLDAMATVEIPDLGRWIDRP